MASLNVSRVTFVKNDPLYGVFVAGDVIDTYFDTTTQSLSVKKNGATYAQAGSSGIDIVDLIAASPYFDQSYRTVNILIPYYCVGTTLFTFSVARSSGTGIFGGGATEWPYLFVDLLPGANICAVTPIVPDLAWTGSAAIIHATSATSQDGSLTYGATSSYGPIFYSLTVGGYLGIPTPSTSATSLSPGTYTWVAQDQKGFKIAYTFTIINMSLNIPVPPLVIPDIQFPSTPSISQDTGPGNGSITFTATSSYAPIQYSLRDFIYGAGQASSTFNNLINGSYILYAIDSKNCRATYAFTIPLNGAVSTPPATAPQQNVIYQMQMTDYNGKPSIVNFVKKSYQSQPTQIDGGSDDPIVHSIRLEGSTDKYAPIVASQLAVTLKSATSYQFQEFFTTDAETYRVQYYKEGALKFVGRMYPQSYQEPYNESTNYPVTVIATDGLIELDNIDFVDDYGARYKGIQKQIVVIALCLARLNFNLNIRSACNLYATTMTSAATDDPLDQAYVDMSSYYDGSEALSCMEVIKRILEPYCASIVQCVGYWYIVRWEELVSSSVDFREYNIIGGYVSNSSMAPIVNIKKSTDASRLVWADAGATLDMITPQGNIEVTYKQGLKDTLVRNGKFNIVKQALPGGVTKDTVDLSGFTLVSNGSTLNNQLSFVNVNGDLTNGALVMKGDGLPYILISIPNFKMLAQDRLTLELKYKTDDFLWDAPYQKIRMSILARGGSNFYMKQDGSWSTSSSEVVIYEQEAGKYKSFTVNAGTPDASLATSNYTLDIRIYTSWIGHTECNGVAALQAKQTSVGGLGVTPNLSENTRTEMLNGGGTYYYLLQNNTSAASTPAIIRPNDYNAVTNPYQWILRSSLASSVFMPTTSSLYLDEINLKFSPGSNDLIEDSVESLTPLNSKERMKKTVYHGSLMETVSSVYAFNLVQNGLMGGFNGELTGSAVGNINPTLTHRNWLRKSDGTTPHILWKRDAVAESERLQSITLKCYAAQYRLPTRRINGRLSNRQINDTIAPVYCTPITMLKENYDGKFYKPQSLVYHDRLCLYEGQFVEVVDITAGGTSTSGGVKTANGTFNTTFG